MVRILVLLACAIDGISYTRLLDLVRSLPDCNDDFAFDFDGRIAASGTVRAAGPVLQFPGRSTSAADAPAHASAACHVSGR